MQVMLANDKVLPEPAPSVRVNKVGDGMVTLAIRPFTHYEHYWDVFFGIQEEVKIAFDKNGIAGPIPTRVIINKQ
jgi:small conductance mechanosensitive channel